MAETETPEKTFNADFEKRHEKELSAGRFVKNQATEIFIPLATAAIGGALGYFVLAKPVKAIAPKFFGGVDHLNDFRKGLLGVNKTSLNEAFRTIESKIGPDVMDRLVKKHPNFKIDSIENAVTAVKEIKNDEIIALKKSLGIEHTEGVGNAKWWSTGIFAFVGSMIGSIFVGFDRWKKEESTRLAAAEIDRDISRLEVFSKRDPELVAENKRLREMLEHTPTAHAPEHAKEEHKPEHHEKPHHDVPHHTIGKAEHHGPVSTHHELQV